MKIQRDGDFIVVTMAGGGAGTADGPGAPGWISIGGGGGRGAAGVNTAGGASWAAMPAARDRFRRTRIIMCRFVAPMGSWLVSCRLCSGEILVQDGPILGFDQVFWIADFARHHLGEHAAGRRIFPAWQRKAVRDAL